MSERHELSGGPQPSGPEASGPEPELPNVPETGNERVDRAMASVADLADLPVAEQHERLVAAHEALHQALDADADESGEGPSAP